MASNQSYVLLETDLETGVVEIRDEHLGILLKRVTDLDQLGEALLWAVEVATEEYHRSAWEYRHDEYADLEEWDY